MPELPEEAVEAVARKRISDWDLLVGSSSAKEAIRREIREHLEAAAPAIRRQRDEELLKRLKERREQARKERSKKAPNFRMVEEFERGTAVIAEFLDSIFGEAD